MDAILKHFRQIEEGLTLMDQGEIHEIVDVLKWVRKNGGTAYLFGNGGSASTASHFANDLMKMGRMRTQCLNDHYPVVSAYGNDEGWMNMYLHPLKNLFIVERDVAVGISCSGMSENVVNALDWAAERKGVTIGLTGQEEGSAINAVQDIYLVHARVPDIRVQEDLHMMVCHAVARAMQEVE